MNNWKSFTVQFNNVNEEQEKAIEGKLMEALKDLDSVGIEAETLANQSTIMTDGGEL